MLEVANGRAFVFVEVGLIVEGIGALRAEVISDWCIIASAGGAVSSETVVRVQGSFLGSITFE